MNPKVPYSTTFVHRFQSPLKKCNKAIRLGLSLLVLQIWALSASAQCTLGCNDDVLVSLDNNCQALVTVSMISPMVQASCQGGNFQVTVMDLNGNVLPGSPYVSAADVGKKRIVKVLDLNSQNSCWGSIVVEDKLPPVFSNCNTEILPCNADINAPGVVTNPLVSDNCSGMVQLSFSDVMTDFPCTNPNFTAMVVRTYTATDQFGNSSTCSKTIFLRKGALSEVVFPKNFDGIQQPVIDCTNASSDPSITGAPTIAGRAINQYCDLIATYSDKVSNGCAGSKIINRTWQVVEMCTGAQLNLVQFIRYEDKIAPTMTCPADLSIGTKATACIADFAMPNLFTADNCSPSNKINFQFAASSGTVSGNAILNLPIGKTTINVTESDDCGNKNTCSFNVTVRDNTPPVAVCSGQKKLSLGGDGTAEISAVAFDAGSSDNCGIDRFEISRLLQTVNFQPKLSFDCSDNNNILTIILRAWDIYGNYNDCISSVLVEDKLNPQINCPNHITINCAQDYRDLAVTGAATATDNCSAVATYRDSVSLNSCGAGTVNRIWTATDLGGRTTTCLQNISIVNPKTIFINNSNPLDPSDDVVWPVDITVSTCGSALNPTSTGSPIITGDLCNQTNIAFEDSEGMPSNGACKQILRKWKVTDFCQYNTNPTIGYWEYTQRINVVNTTPPIFSSSCQDISLTLDPGNCVSQILSMTLSASDDCSDATNLIWLVNIDLNNDGSTDRTLNSGNISGSYPMGKSTVYASVNDGCGNIQNCSFGVFVVENAKPTAVCKSGVSVNVDSTGSVSPDAKLFDGGSSDQCTASADLRFGISPATFSCALLGPNLLTFTVTDKSGNTDVCMGFVEVTDKDNKCPSTVYPSAAIGGSILTAQNQGVDKVEIMMNGAFSQTSSSSAGSYLLVRPKGHQYMVKPERKGDDLNGVSTFDVVRMTRHILGLDRITNPYTLIAADVNKNGTISSADIVATRRVILGLTAVFAPSQQSWRFVRKDFSFVNPLNPFATAFPEYSIVNLNGDQIADFVAVKIGDLNNSAKPNSNTPAGQRNSGETLQIFSEDIEMTTGKTYRIPLSIKDKDVNGMQFTLKIRDEVELLNIAAGELPDMSAANFAVLDKNTITASWNATQELGEENVVAVLTLSAKENVSLSEILALNSEVTNAEAYNSADELMDVKLNFGKVGNNTASNSTELHQNEPNPFKEGTRIKFYLPQSTEATFKVTDINGKMVYSSSNYFEKGTHSFYLNKNELSNTSSGIYFYQLLTPTQHRTGKMIIVD